MTGTTVYAFNPALEQHYFDKFVSPEPNTGCWIWTGSLFKDGYGHVYRDGTTCSAHRAMWQFRNGAMAREKHACHSCDTPACVNPDHVWPGTDLDNRRDLLAKGRPSKRNKVPAALGSRTATKADAEAAMLDPAIDIGRAEMLVRRVYKKRDPAWVEDRISTLRLERDRRQAA